jgi:NAD-dependent SIR2 family protein deacetylase
MPELSAAFDRAASFLGQAEGLFVSAGAGMGVDSGLPDFRGTQGFWRAYPALGRAGMAFEDIASPDNFYRDPRLAWGFYGHRLALYRATEPHAGFAILRRFLDRLPEGGFVFTSNVDGQFQKAGFDPARICEVHGSIHHLQCCGPCKAGDAAIWPATSLQPEIDSENCRWLGDVPHCPTCGGVARPNILMFGDGAWLGQRSRAQHLRLESWRRRIDRLLVIELGAGLAVPTVRWFGESLGVPLIRINPRESEVQSSQSVSLPLGAVAALAAIEARL